MSEKFRPQSVGAGEERKIYISYVVSSMIKSRAMLLHSHEAIDYWWNYIHTYKPNNVWYGENVWFLKNYKNTWHTRTRKNCSFHSSLFWTVEAKCNKTHIRPQIVKIEITEDLSRLIRDVKTGEIGSSLKLNLFSS